MKFAVIRDDPPASLMWSEKLVQKLINKDYRHAYVAEGVKTWIARQIRTLREQRGWSQEDLGRETGKSQSAISRIEDPDYGKVTVKTLLEFAAAYDVALVIQFVEWNDWLRRMDDVSKVALQKESFDAQKLQPAATSAQGGILITYVADDPADWSLLTIGANRHANATFNVGPAAGAIVTPPAAILGKIEIVSATTH